jgi:hypothetical protein
MRICDLQTGSIRLSKAAKHLREKWEETKPLWHDQNAADFEFHYYLPLTPQLTRTLAAVNRLASLFEQVERDCWDEDRLE